MWPLCTRVQITSPDWLLKQPPMMISDDFHMCLSVEVDSGNIQRFVVELRRWESRIHSVILVMIPMREIMSPHPDVALCLRHV